MAYKKKKKVEMPIVSASVVKLPVVPKQTVSVSTTEKTCTFRARKFLADLKGNYLIFRKYFPLAIGIEKQIQERFTQHPKRIINIALYLHTHNYSYLNNLQKGKSRFNLDGSVAQSVDVVAKTLAKNNLCTIRQNVETLREKTKRQLPRPKEPGLVRSKRLYKS